LKKLADLDEREARVVELRYFGGLTAEEIASLLGVSERTVRNDWAFARAWLKRELSEEPGA
jgi:RNA polymerase sigma factor (sigma-70 family)